MVFYLGACDIRYMTNALTSGTTVKTPQGPGTVLSTWTNNVRGTTWVTVLMATSGYSRSFCTDNVRTY